MKIIFENSIREYECNIVTIDLSIIIKGRLLITKDASKLRQVLQNIQNLPFFMLVEPNYHYFANCNKCSITSIQTGTDWQSDGSMQIEIGFYVPRYISI